MKINIYFPFTDGPFGGGNQFLKALRNYLKKTAEYEEMPENADIILFNSHHNVSELIKLKRKYPQKIFIHRIDGPVFLIRNDNRILDKLIYTFNDKIADASIFQSEWSKIKNYELGIKKKQFETIILNAPDSEIFNKKEKLKFKSGGKTKIIATSWASNINKGFETYAFLDENLDFTKYEMTFCGNSPVKFKNIKHIKPLPSKELAKILKKHDIFITASKNDPCSNALIEAMHCGLPAIGLNDGGHPQIMGKGGLTFNDNNEIIEKIKTVTENYSDFQNNIKLPDMNETGQKYFEFMQKVYDEIKIIQKLNIFDSVLLQKSILTNKIVKHLKR